MTRVFDVGVLDDGVPYMVMEYLDGENLSDLLGREGPLPVAVAVDFVLQASEAIGEAHRIGVVHRDLKPSNLFCIRRADGAPWIKVLDFGISKMSSAGGSAASMSMTRTATVIGTPLYMSPEQLESARSADARSDIWALGIILYELLCGHVPFMGETLPEVCVKISLHSPPAITTVRGDVPEALVDVILKCLAKNRDRRFQTVAELTAALEPFGLRNDRSAAGQWPAALLSPKSGATTTPRPSSAPRPPVQPESLSALGATGLTPRRPPLRRTLMIVIAGGILGVALGAQVVFRRHPPAPTAILPAVASSSLSAPVEDLRPLPAGVALDGAPSSSESPSGSGSETAASISAPKNPAVIRAQRRQLGTPPVPAQTAPNASTRDSPKPVAAPSASSPLAPLHPKGSNAYDERLSNR